MTESQWVDLYTNSMGKLYINQTTVPDSTKLIQLQAACSDTLRQRIFDTGLYNALTTSDLFLAKMEEIAVTNVLKSVHFCNRWSMDQQADEHMRAFVARLNATA